MSKLRLISFDASIGASGKVSIGILEHKTKTSIRKTYNIKTDSSLVAERIALIETLKYIKSNDIEGAHLFTDNKTLAHEGIKRKVLKNYVNNLGKFTLNWVPREFNKEADKLSKPEVKEVDPEMLFNIKIAIKQKPFTDRVKLLKRLARNEGEVNFIRGIEINTPAENCGKFGKFAITMFSKDEIPKIYNKNHTVTGTKLANFIKGRLNGNTKH